MLKLFSLVVAVMLLLPTTNSGREKFAKYKPVEAYEIQPGILMMPRYSADGQVCEIGIESATHRRYFGIRFEDGLVLRLRGL